MEPREDDMLTRSLPAHLVRTQFGQILERVSIDHERFIVTKNGQPKAVIIGIEDFLAAVAKPSETMKALQDQARASGAAGMSLEEIEAEIAAVRQKKTVPQPS
ncbi:type II toxin-antitoxin system Phd/YefM family antitoxin [Candidatus Entotheonella palauensis]|uniref:Antitoxin n=1 Tax=Candidatus Entotheonella gemina TaxID=1429439 RepID=W4LZA2_9BACT|nr:type II toxin-antitoxin system Phd/YefM family antitoxin [Candidatus Entotheonella palauensis]ETX02707.1 MAG: hypothetical protein ETSY2_34995 [Candidatus Entotheonella gemina]